MRRSLLFVLLMIPYFALSQVAVELEQVVNGFTNPVDIVNAGDARLFIVERPGVIKILRPDGSVNTTPFLDISGPVNSGSGEQGLLGLAFHPQYSSNGFFYVYYNAGTGNGNVRISRFTVSADPDIALPNSEVVLWQLSYSNTNHNGGDLAFGPDGYLYFAPGDGGGAGDPNNLAQNMADGHGKMHRIDVDGGSPFSIPPSNPFATADNADTLRTIWASGLRNPFRFGFDQLTGDLWIGDVGQSVKEELDLIPANTNTGPNFGWRCYEGTVPYTTTGCAPSSNYVQPVIDHDQDDQWCSIIAGRVYRGSRYPALYGRFIYTDFCHGRIHSLRPVGNGWVHDTLRLAGSQGLAAFGEDVSGELYVCNTINGTLYRLYDPSATVQLQTKVFLKGPYNEGNGLMNDGLRSAGLVPTLEPYSALNYPRVAGGGGETISPSIFNTTGNNAVVDWVRVELRPFVQPTLIAAVAHGLVQRDGDIVGTDNTSPLTFRTGPGNYHVVVRHRNHLGVMTAAPFNLSAGATLIDLTSNSVPNYGVNAQYETNGGVRALWSGNCSGDTSVQYTGDGNDRDIILERIGGVVPTNSINGYYKEDVNLDGVALYTGPLNDRDLILTNIGGVVPTSTVVQQLP